MKKYNCDNCYMAKKREYHNQRVCRQFDWRVSPEGLMDCIWGIDDQDISNAMKESINLFNKEITNAGKRSIK